GRRSGCVSFFVFKQKTAYEIRFDGFGDLTVVTKFAILNDQQTGDTLSGGLAVTLPTGHKVVLATGHSLGGSLIQPWAGFVLNSDRFYVQGFTALIIPTEKSDVTLLTGDLGVGYKLEVADDRFLVTQITPTLELHGDLPLNHV